MKHPSIPRSLALLAVVATLMTAVATPVAAQETSTLVLAPTDDATIRESRPTNNYGASSLLEVDASSRKDILLRFDLSGLSVAAATLRLYVVDPSPSGGTFTAMTNSAWSESLVTWNNAPPGDGADLGALGPVSSGSWYELDVTDLVTRDGPVSIRITSDDGNGADYASKEHANGNTPQLVVELGDPPLPDSEQPTAPENLAAQAPFSSQVVLTWDASTDNIGVVGYDIYREGNLTASTSAITFTDVTVAPETTYQYFVVARDAFGNASDPSDTVEVTTPAGQDATFDIVRTGTTSTYSSISQTSPSSYSGSLKFVVESALDELRLLGGGSIVFGAGDFDLGTDHFELSDVTDVTFSGAGMGVTTIRNSTNEAADTEPFDAVRSDRLTIRDLTVSAGGSDRTTSDALDFDGGDDILIERVEVTDSRGRGIVFDGKDSVSSTGGTAERNVVRDCVVTNVPRDGIQLLAANHNTIENCRITNAGAEGIRIHLASSGAAQPYKPSNDNVITGNTIENANGNGITVTGGSRNRIQGNTVLNSGADGILVFTSTSTLYCDDNVVDQNEAHGNGYGLKINSSNCRRTVVADNDFTGNSAGPILDNGTDTVYTSSDDESPSSPSNLLAGQVLATQVTLVWDPATDNTAVTGYELHRDGDLIASIGAVTTYQDTTVEPATTYTYSVVARDAAGNASDPSDEIQVATPNLPPVSTIVLTPTDDATIRASRPTENFGANPSLEVDASSKKDILLKFDVSGLTGSVVTGATLRLYAIDPSPHGGTVFSATDSAWSEDVVTFDSAPDADGATIGSIGAVATGGWYEVDVSSIVTGNGVVTFRISSPNSNGADYASKENANGNAPQLVITTELSSLGGGAADGLTLL